MTTPRLTCGFPAFVACFLLAAHVTADEPKPNPAADMAAFEKAAAGAAWAEVFSDSCTADWKEKWFLDGEVGTVTNSPEGMTLTAGPEFRDDAHHMVLWTKDSFEGELKIEYEYTRLDKAPNCVTILYIQATGSGKGPYAKDITKWSGLRKTPAMKMYYDHMHSCHISYANLRVSRPVPGGEAGAEPNIGKLRSELRARSAESASFLSAAEPASGEAQEKAVIVGLIGDSTVAVQSGWGPAFAQRFDRRAKIVNYAKNGATLQALSKKLDALVQLKPDYVLIQFGHNFKEGDKTHFNKKGAEAITDLILEELKAVVPELAAYLKVEVDAEQGSAGTSG